MTKTMKSEMSQDKLSIAMGLIPVIIYVRVSSDEQKEGFSIPAQIELLVNYARHNNMRIVRIFEESMSAKDSGRIEFNRMLKYLKTHPDTKTILVEKTDRLYRNFKDYATLDDNKYEIHLVKENEVLSKDSTSHQKLVHGLKVLLAKNFVDNLREETYKGRKKKAEEGFIVAACPYGYKKKDPRTVLIVPEQAEFVKLCFKYYLEEGTLNKTKERLRSEGHVYREKCPLVTRGQLHRILKTVTYTGQIEFEGELFPAKHEAIITKDLFDQVQLQLRKERSYVHEYLFPKVIKCERCGRHLVAEVVKSDFIYYHCSGGSRSCKQKHIHVREEFIENQFIKAISRIQVSDEKKRYIIFKLKQMIKDVKYINTDQKDATVVEMERIQGFMNTLYNDKLLGNISEEFWLKKNTDLQAQIDDLKAKIESMKVTSTSNIDECMEFITMIEKLPEMWKTGGFKVRQKIARLVFNKVTIKGRICKFYYAMPFKYFVDAEYRM